MVIYNLCRRRCHRLLVNRATCLRYSADLISNLTIRKPASYPLAALLGVGVWELFFLLLLLIFYEKSEYHGLTNYSRPIASLGVAPLSYLSSKALSRKRAPKPPPTHTALNVSFEKERERERKRER